MDAAAARAALDHYLRHSAAGDEETAHSIYAEDAVLEFPQSGERFEGVGNFLPWRQLYPAAVEYEVQRVRGSGDVVDRRAPDPLRRGPWNHGLDLLEFRGDKVAAESIYVFEGWDAPDWRSKWWATPPRRAGT